MSSEGIGPPTDSDEVPPRPQTDEEFAALPILDLSQAFGRPTDSDEGECPAGIVLQCTLPPGHDDWHFHEDDDGRLWRWPNAE